MGSDDAKPQAESGRQTPKSRDSVIAGPGAARLGAALHKPHGGGTVAANHESSVKSSNWLTALLVFGIMVGTLVVMIVFAR